MNGAYSYTLLDDQGKSLGRLISARFRWEAGDRVVRGPDQELLEVVSVVRSESGDDVRAYLVVRPIA